MHQMLLPMLQGVVNNSRKPRASWVILHLAIPFLQRIKIASWSCNNQKHLSGARLNTRKKFQLISEKQGDQRKQNIFAQLD